jgi:molybdopterin-guanine dinucleotide biosynthesis protein MobB
MNLALIINIVGIGRASGKTSLVEFLTKKLRQRGYKVSTVKHISSGFDTVQKDTWRHLDAGALSVVAATPEEVISIKKIQNPSLEVTLGEIPKETDIVIVEGFKSSKYPKVIASQTIKNAETLLKDVEATFAISGPVVARSRKTLLQGVPILSPDELLNKVEEMVIQNIVEVLPGLNCRTCGYASCDAFAQTLLKRKTFIDQCIPLQETQVTLKVNNKQVYLSSFPANLIKNVVLGMVHTLKGTDRNSLHTISLDLQVD